MKIDPGYGAYLEPDKEPRKTPFHKRIVGSRRVPNTSCGHWLYLACGHQVMAFGDLKQANGVVLCARCRDDAAEVAAIHF